jgi:hypothetical protein
MLWMAAASVMAAVADNCILVKHRLVEYTVDKSIGRYLPPPEPDLARGLSVGHEAAILILCRESEELGDPRKGLLFMIFQAMTQPFFRRVLKLKHNQFEPRLVRRHIKLDILAA